MPHPSVSALWERYRALSPDAPATLPSVEHFCDNREDADTCAALIVNGRKRATASALIDYQREAEPLPTPGKLVIVTSWAGEARALIRTHTVTIRCFGDIPATFAFLEGEGDRSLAFWRETHRAFWTRPGPAGVMSWMTTSRLSARNLTSCFWPERPGHREQRAGLADMGECKESLLN
jgi:uncharacterized protein YhfF